MVFDNVGGEGFPVWLKVLKVGGKYVTSGAIGGPFVQLDMRDLYLKDIQMIGCTLWDERVMPNLVKYVENQKIQPLIYKTYKLDQIVDA